VGRKIKTDRDIFRKEIVWYCGLMNEIRNMIETLGRKLLHLRDSL